MTLSPKPDTRQEFNCDNAIGLQTNKKEKDKYYSSCCSIAISRVHKSHF